MQQCGLTILPRLIGLGGSGGSAAALPHCRTSGPRLGTESIGPPEAVFERLAEEFSSR